MSTASISQLVDALLGRVRRSPQASAIDCIAEQLPLERFTRDTARAMADEILLRVVLDRADEPTREEIAQADGYSARNDLASPRRPEGLEALATSAFPPTAHGPMLSLLGKDPLLNHEAIPMLGARPVDLIALARFAIECEELLPIEIRKDASRARYAGVQHALHRIGLVARVLRETQNGRNGPNA